MEIVQFAVNLKTNATLLPLPKRCVKFHRGSRLHAMSQQKPDSIAFFTGDIANIEKHYGVNEPVHIPCGSSKSLSNIYTWLGSVIIFVLSLTVW